MQLISQPPVHIDTVEVSTPFGLINLIAQFVVPLFAVFGTWLVARWRYSKDAADLRKAATAADERHRAELGHQRKLHSEQIDRFIANDKYARQADFLSDASATLVDVSVAAQTDSLTDAHASRIRQIALRAYTVFYGDDDRGFAHFGKPAFFRIAEAISAITAAVHISGHPVRSTEVREARSQLERDAADLAMWVAIRKDPGISQQADDRISQFGSSGTFTVEPGS